MRTGSHELAGRIIRQVILMDQLAEMIGTGYGWPRCTIRLPMTATSHALAHFATLVATEAKRELEKTAADVQEVQTAFTKGGSFGARACISSSDKNPLSI